MVRVGNIMHYVERDEYELAASYEVKVLKIKKEVSSVPGKRYYLLILEDLLDSNPEHPSKKGNKFNVWRRDDYIAYNERMSVYPGHARGRNGWCFAGERQHER